MLRTSAWSGAGLPAAVPDHVLVQPTLHEVHKREIAEAPSRMGIVVRIKLIYVERRSLVMREDLEHRVGEPVIAAEHERTFSPRQRRTDQGLQDCGDDLAEPPAQEDRLFDTTNDLQQALPDRAVERSARPGRSSIPVTDDGPDHFSAAPR